MAPATDWRIEGLNEALLLGMFVASDGLPERVHMSVDGRWARGDRGPEAVPTAATILPGRGFSSGVLLDVEAKEIASRSL